jgi:hypothetical protein
VGFGIGWGFGDRQKAESAARRSRIIRFGSWLTLWLARRCFEIIKAAAHHLSSTRHTTLDPNKRFLIPQTFFPRISTLSTGGLAIVADNATSSAGIATFGHSLGVIRETNFLNWIAKN